MADWRLEVLLEPERSGRSVAEVCARNGISRDTFYRWKRRLEAVGMTGLLDRSCEPINQPRRIPYEMEKAICDLRRAHPKWGARTLVSRMRRHGLEPPATSTVHRVLVRNDLVIPDPAKRPRVLIRRFERPSPNDLWQMDDTEVELTSGAKAKVLAILDDHARFLVGWTVCKEVTSDVAWIAFSGAARNFGLPRQLLSDNALAFTGRLHGHEVAFERNLRAVGVRFIHGRPHHPQTQGKVERFHQTLQAWIEEAGGAATKQELEALVAAFADDYNNHRPHQALDDFTPAERYRPTDVLLDDLRRLQEIGSSPTYPEGSIVRKVDTNGYAFFEYLRIAVGSEWAHRLVRIQPAGDELKIFYGTRLLRTLVPDRSKRTQSLPHPRSRKLG